MRIAARESSKQRANEMYPEMENRNQQQMRAYRELSTDELFDVQWVKVKIGSARFSGIQGNERHLCADCGEGINFGRRRQVERDGRIVCRSSAPASDIMSPPEKMLRYYITDRRQAGTKLQINEPAC